MGGAMTAVATRPRLGFLGVGWIGRHRLEAVAASGCGDVTAVADPAVDDCLDSLDDLLAHDLDGIVIATPSALHADQAIAALEAGLAVFCQKPLARTAAETRRVVEAARQADRLLAVDLSYRWVRAARVVRDLVASGALGEVYAVDLVFHNAHGPDRAWFYDPELAGGGCVIDVGSHLVDLVLWALPDAHVVTVTSSLRGEPVERYAAAQLELDTGAVVRLACSWALPAGRDCAIEASFYGTSVGAALRNVGGSFFDFVAERFDGTATTVLAEPPDNWGGRAIVDWARRLGGGERFDPANEQLAAVAEVVDRIYGRAT
jgi:predicted dehydrogenase